MKTRTAFNSLCLSAVLLTGTADAHGGFENETEVRVYADRMRVVVRTSVPFAWSLLRVRAPRAADEAGQAIATPLLAAEAPGLFEVTAGGKTLAPTGSDCLFEVHDLVAFTWPSAAGVDFQILRCRSLALPWAPIGNVTATGSSATFTDSAPPAGKAFYKVLILD